LRGLEETVGASFWRFGSDFRRQPKVALSLRDNDIGVGEEALSVLCGEARPM